MGRKSKGEGVISHKKAFGELDEKVVEGFDEVEAEEVEESVESKINEEATTDKVVESAVKVGTTVFSETFGEGKIIEVKKNGHFVGNFGGSQRTLSIDDVEVV